MSSGKYGSWSLEQLRAELRKRGAKTSGRKKEMSERLEAYDRNFNFGRSDAQTDDFKMSLPNENSYYDLNSDREFPEVTINNINNYLETYHKSIEKVSREMYKEKFLLYIRTAQLNEKYFVRSACRAEMSKSVVYKIDISFNSDGFVHESQCECATGMGPNAHCKHVCKVLHGMTEFCRVHHVVFEQTCTERLQKFHHVKRYKGSPVKSCNLEIDGANILCDSDFDPRPPNMRNKPGYSDYFRNLCLSSSGISTLPIFQTFTPANAFAVAHDHDYFVYTPEDNFLSHFGLNNIDEKVISKIEQNTREQSSSRLWAQERSKRLCSSSFGRICKLTDLTDKVKLAKSYLKPPQKLNAHSILHGKKYESVAIKHYEKLRSCEVSKCGLFVSEAHPFLAASPDGIVRNEKPYLVKVKCPYASREMQITEKSIPYLELDDKGALTLKRNHDYFFSNPGPALLYTVKEV